MAGRPPLEPARQLERAHRILDAAGELILRWGYDKTTIDDVAKQADVAKGTIYLHWKTREELFAALLRRERVRMLAQVRQARPETLRDLLVLLATELLRRPLMRAMLVSDTEVLGKLARQRQSGSSSMELGTAFEDYLGRLVKLGVLRADLTPGEHVLVISSTVYGFMTLQAMVPEERRTPDGRLVELIADACVRALGWTPSAPEAQALLDYLDTIAELAERRLAGSLRSV
ncbi:TetR/AcrR family transcriptional regulator [Nonomuraea sediminis]|uniref:TetR/AcrR family transcriptional regulator n=1 Tax=Nonomuraea sediminis TaxID=2835864 RepID=UPI001BDC3468|nr:TetR/AcrR family transcriptional regulator [Nonomuraea sediminis]